MRPQRRRSRKAVANLVATIIIFAILFTVGTSYFVFLGSENASYVSNLLAATNKAQGSLQESISVNTVLESNGDVGFDVNNTSSQTVNMTAALVVSSAGLLLKCDGVGFPAGAGAATPLPRSGRPSTPAWGLLPSIRGTCTWPGRPTRSRSSPRAETPTPPPIRTPLARRLRASRSP